jgi:integrase
LPGSIPFNGNHLQRKAGVTKYFQYLEDDSNLHRWHENLKRGSEYTADIYLRRLCSFCRKGGITPGHFADISLSEIEDMAQDYVNELEESTFEDGKHYAPQYICSNLKAIKSWAEWNRKKITREIRIRDETRTPTLEAEEVPSRDDLERVLYAPTTNSRTRASIAIIALSGCRLEVQGNRNGNDGLRMEDVPDLKIVQAEGKKTEAVFEKVPARVVVRACLSKTRKQYFTYLPEEGCEILSNTWMREFQQVRNFIRVHQ